MDECIACYWNAVDDNVFETFVRTFRRHHKNALLQVHTNDQRRDWQRDMNRRYNVHWCVDVEAAVKGRRALRKLELVKQQVCQADPGDVILVSDVDTYYMAEVFERFRDYDCDVGITTRLYRYWAPVNGGVWFVRPSEQVQRMLEYLLPDGKEVVLAPADFPQTYRKWPDWFVDQDLLCFLWQYRSSLLRSWHVRVTDLGPLFNYCPGTDVFELGLAKALLRTAYQTDRAYVLHLKSKLKECVYEGWLADAVTGYEKGASDWLRAASS